MSLEPQSMSSLASPASAPGTWVKRLDGAHGVQRWAGAVVLLVSLGMHLRTLSISPPYWQDESQIVDWGRTTLFEAHSPWSVNTLPDGRSVPMLFYLGPTLQELAYRVFAPDPVGTRIASLLGALLAVSALYVWLRRRGNLAWESGLAAGLLFLDTLFVASYRGARVDALAMAVFFGALALLRRDASTAPRSMLVGAGFTASVFVWPSAFMLAPIALAELYASARQPLLLRRLGALCLGAVALSALLLGLLYVCNPETFALTATMVRSQFGEHPQSLLERARVVRDILRVSPLICLAVVCLLLRWPARATTLAALGVLAILFAGLLYSMRIVYFTPYAAWIIADALREQRERHSALRPLATLAVGFGFACALGILGLRTAIALDQRAGRDPDLLLRAARQAIGQTHAQVYLEQFTFYFPGRELGWHMVRPYGSADPYAPRLLASDYAVVTTGGELEARLLAAGMRVIGRMDRPAPGAGVLAGLGGLPYGGYTFLARLSAMNSE